LRPFANIPGRAPSWSTWFLTIAEPPKSCDCRFMEWKQNIIKWCRNRPKFHMIYITNFKCGPDSFVRHFITKASGSPYLTLQFDGHGNDAGYVTRCEAYLDSKGVLRPWAQQ